MRRRNFLVGLGAAGVTGAGAMVGVGGWNPLDSTERLEPLQLESLAVPGGAPGTLVVPEYGRVSFVEFFATWCTVCQGMMEPLGTVYDTVEDAVQFVSVTNEPLGRTTTRDDVAAWWEEHDGRWPVVYDETLELTDMLSGHAVPHSVVLDAQNHITWAESGAKTAANLRQAIQAASE